MAWASDSLLSTLLLPEGEAEASSVRRTSSDEQAPAKAQYRSSNCNREYF
jgi:hypothetical protein